MEPPRIALRFRDSTVGVDTIQAHQDVIKHFSSVYWGWWKKGNEPDYERLVVELIKLKDFRLVLIDRSEQRMYECICRSVARDDSSIENEEQIPLYYRGFRKAVFAWFELTSIKDAKFDEELSLAIGSRTILDLVDKTQTPLNEISVLDLVRAKPESTCILHLSDLHFGDDYNFARAGEAHRIGNVKKTLTDCLVEDLKRLDAHKKIGSILITGDITTRDNWKKAVRDEIYEELLNLSKALQVDIRDFIILPGNHDISRYDAQEDVKLSERPTRNQIAMDHEVQFRNFLYELTRQPAPISLNQVHRRWLSDWTVYICGLNSCAIAATRWTEYGYVGQEGIDALETLREVPNEDKVLKIMALHHHLLPVVPEEGLNENGISMTLDAGQLLDRAQQVGVAIALHGHQHHPRMARYSSQARGMKNNQESLVVVSNGSAGATVTRLPENEGNTYCLIDLTKDRPTIRIRQLRTDGHEGEEIFQTVVG